MVGKLTLVDLAGSERAAETNNQGQKLRDGKLGHAPCCADAHGCSCHQPVLCMRKLHNRGEEDVQEVAPMRGDIIMMHDDA